MAANPSARTLVIGLGYIGLPTAIALAEAGEDVLGIDANPQLVRQINAGLAPHLEPGLQAALDRALRTGRLHAATQVQPASTYLIAVPTPLGPCNVPDLQHVHAALAAIAPHLMPGCLILLESTCPVGTTEALRDRLADLRPDLRLPYADAPAKKADVALAYCPERVLPGQILKELAENSRCIGGITPRCADRAVEFYRKFVRGACNVTTSATAELVKLAENSFRDVNIAFANELSMAAARLNVDIWEVIRLANHHPRVDILRPGPGVGGHCVAVDPWFLINGGAGEMALLRTARAVNQAKAQFVVEQVAAQLEAHSDMCGVLLGLTFKADSQDLRESPALIIAQHLAQRFGSRILLVDPYVPALPDDLSASGAHLVSLEVGLARAGHVTLLVDHAPFRALTPAALVGKSVYDTRGIWPAGGRP